VSLVAPATASRVEASIVAHRQFVKIALRINCLPSWGIQHFDLLEHSLSMFSLPCKNNLCYYLYVKGKNFALCGVQSSQRFKNVRSLRSPDGRHLAGDKEKK